MSRCLVTDECEKINSLNSGIGNYCNVYKSVLNLTNENCSKNLINVKNVLKSNVNKIDENIKLYNLNNIYKMISILLLILINIFLIIIINRIF